MQAVNFYKCLTEFYLNETLLPSLFLIASLSESIKLISSSFYEINGQIQ